MKIFFGIVHILVCLALICSVLVQQRKSGGFTGAFGGGGTQMENSNSWQRMSSMTKLSAGLMFAFVLLAMIQVLIR